MASIPTLGKRLAETSRSTSWPCHTGGQRPSEVVLEFFLSIQQQDGCGVVLAMEVAGKDTGKHRVRLRHGCEQGHG